MEHFIEWDRLFHKQEIELGKKLFKIFRKECKKYWFASPAKTLVSVLHYLSGNYLKDEIQQISRIFNVSREEVLAANLLYDVTTMVGCSTIAVDTYYGPLHARNLDWIFPGKILKKSVCVLDAHSEDDTRYQFATWPGLLGVFTGFSPGRFSVTVNQVTHKNPIEQISAVLSGHYPVSWAVRKCMEESSSFQELISSLASIPLLSPTLLVVCGAKTNERALIERTCETSLIYRPKRDVPLVVTNHYQGISTPDPEEDEDSLDRYKYLTRCMNRTDQKGFTTRKAFGLLSRDQIIRDFTQYQAAMRPATDDFRIEVPGGTRK